MLQWSPLSFVYQSDIIAPFRLFSITFVYCSTAYLSALVSDEI